MMTDIVERLLKPDRVSAPYPEGWHEVVDPVKKEAAEEIERLRKALEPFANLHLYPYDIEGQLEFEKEQLDWSEEENDKVQDDFFITRKAIRNARKALGK